MEIPPPEFFGFKSFKIVLRDEPNRGWKIYAKNANQAWNKFVAQQFRNLAMKPDRSNFTVRCEK